jgi:hypothetical protein
VVSAWSEWPSGDSDGTGTADTPAMVRTLGMQVMLVRHTRQDRRTG